MDLDAVLALPLEVASIGFDRLEAATSSDFTRVSTVVTLRGANAVGRGEDVAYEAEAHERLASDPPAYPDTFSGRLGEYLAAIDAVDLGPAPEDTPAIERFRRWSIESAALDLALTQAGTNLAEALDRSYNPLRFVASTRLGEPPTTDRLAAYRAAVANIEFKLDPTAEWTPSVIDEVATVGGVRILDFKGQYDDVEVAQAGDPDRYATLLDRFPEAIIEDPAVSDATEPILTTTEAAISWDAPIHSVTDLEEVPIPPDWINVKPSRIGSLRRVFDLVATCRARNIGLYGGGQFELGVGRGQIQALASIAYPTGPNDVAPRAYNLPTLPDELPASPLAPPSESVGYGW